MAGRTPGLRFGVIIPPDSKAEATLAHEAANPRLARKSNNVYLSTDPEPGFKALATCVDGDCLTEIEQVQRMVILAGQIDRLGTIHLDGAVRVGVVTADKDGSTDGVFEIATRLAAPGPWEAGDQVSRWAAHAKAVQSQSAG
jgi:hypothetical protein